MRRTAAVAIGERRSARHFLRVDEAAVNIRGGNAIGKRIDSQERETGRCFRGRGGLLYIDRSGGYYWNHSGATEQASREKRGTFPGRMKNPDRRERCSGGFDGRARSGGRLRWEEIRLFSRRRSLD